MLLYQEVISKLGVVMAFMSLSRPVHLVTTYFEMIFFRNRKELRDKRNRGE
jgi:hypothetical protein